ncbi:MAG TPA: type II toxin-antitoxin system VapC family toxin [Candidatus Cybelea sp.]
MAIVVDVSVAAKWFLRDERSRFADSILDRVARETAYVPALFRWEMQSVLLAAEKANRITSTDVDDAFDALRDLPIFVDPPGERLFSGSGVQLARHYGLTQYDAAYIALASNRRLSLTTSDAELSYAAHDLGIAVLSD